VHYGRSILREVGNAVDHVLVRCVVDKDVDGAHSRHGLLHELLAIVLFGDIGGVEVDLAADLLDLLLGLLGIRLFFGQIVDETLCAFHGEQDSDGPADTGIPASDKCFLSLELAGRFVDLVATIFGGDLFGCGGRTFHFGLESRLFEVMSRNLMTWKR